MACHAHPAALTWPNPLAHPCSLVLDLDETLVHSTLDGYCRPGARQFLMAASCFRARGRVHSHWHVQQPPCTAADSCSRTTNCSMSLWLSPCFGSRPADFMFPVEVGTMRHMVSVRQRPHLHTFLERVSQLYEVRWCCAAAC